jgi:hypothetical protein
MTDESEMWYPSPELQAAVDVVNKWMDDYDLGLVYDAEGKKSPSLDLAERIRAAVSAAVAEERETTIQVLETIAQGQRELARIEKEEYLDWDAARIAQKIAEAIDHVARCLKTQGAVDRSRASGGNGGAGEEE